MHFQCKSPVRIFKKKATMILSATRLQTWLPSSRAVPLAILLVGTVLTLLLYGWALQGESLKRANDIARLAATLRGDLSNRIQAYIDTLPGLRTLYQRGKAPDDRQFEEYVNTLSLQQRFPALALTFTAEHVAQQNLKKFTEGVRQDKSLHPKGHPDFVVTPKGMRPDYMVIRHIFPLVDNTLGYDLFDPAAGYRAAVDAAIGKGAPVATGPLRLVRDSGASKRPENTNVVIRLAVYRRGAQTRTEKDRVRAVVGVVGVAFNTTELVRSVLSAESVKNLHVRIVDTQSRNDGQAGVVFDTDWAFVDNESAATGLIRAQRVSMNVADRLWELVLTDQSAEFAYWLKPVPMLVAVLGTSITMFLALIYYILIRSNEISTKEIARATRDLLRKQHSLEAAQRIARVGSWEWDISGERMQWSGELSRILGFGMKEAAGSYEVFLAAVHPEDRAMVQKAMHEALENKTRLDLEYRIVRRDGTEEVLHARGEVVLDDEGLPVRMTGTVLDVTQRRRAAEDIKRLAYFDALTGLPNRHLLMDRLGHTLRAAQRSKDMGAVAFIDLDNFKNVNDSRGHAVGDKLLEQVASRLSALMRESDTIARLGGDEFVVIMEGLGKNQDNACAAAMLLAQKMCAALEVPIDIDGQPCHSGASIGVALFPKTDQESVGDLLREADTAMYRAKEAGRSQIAFFEASMGVFVNQRIMMENELKAAMVQHQLSLYVQTQVDRRERPAGCELMLRWRHPQKGLILASSFMPIAERSGLVLKIGDWVLREACATVAIMREAGSLLPVSMNVSTRQFREPDFVRKVSDMLRETGADATQLIFEIKESLLLDNPELNIARMCKLADMGIRFTIDDFGTGYSSLSQLKRLPIYSLKIDKTLVQDIKDNGGDSAIVQSILAMAGLLGMRVIAEGVESRAQADLLIHMGCDCLQGYYFAKPIPMTEWLETEVRLS